MFVLSWGSICGSVSQQVEEAQSLWSKYVKEDVVALSGATRAGLQKAIDAGRGNGHMLIGLVHRVVSGS